MILTKNNHILGLRNWGAKSAYAPPDFGWKTKKFPIRDDLGKLFIQSYFADGGKGQLISF